MAAGDTLCPFNRMKCETEAERCWVENVASEAEVPGQAWAWLGVVDGLGGKQGWESDLSCF